MHEIKSCLGIPCININRTRASIRCPNFHHTIIVFGIFQRHFHFLRFCIGLIHGNSRISCYRQYPKYQLILTYIILHFHYILNFFCAATTEYNTFFQKYHDVFGNFLFPKTSWYPFPLWCIFNTARQLAQKIIYQEVLL